MRVSGTSEDTYITALIKAARRRIESETNRALCTQTLRLTMDRFPCSRELRLEYPKLQSVTSVNYVARNGDSQVFDSSLYTVDVYSTPGRIVLKTGERWPDTIDNANSVWVIYEAGFGAAADVPDDLVQALRFLVGHWYANREPVVVQPGVAQVEIPKTLDYILQPWRVY